MGVQAERHSHMLFANFNQDFTYVDDGEELGVLLALTCSDYQMRVCGYQEGL